MQISLSNALSLTNVGGHLSRSPPLPIFISSFQETRKLPSHDFSCITWVFCLMPPKIVNIHMFFDIIYVTIHNSKKTTVT